MNAPAKSNVVPLGTRVRMKISSGLIAIAKMAGRTAHADNQPQARFVPPVLPRGVVPDATRLAMDADPQMIVNYAYLNQYGAGGDAFIGYPMLAEMTQRAEYRMLSEKTAQNMCRKWIKLTSTEGDKTDLIAELETAMEHFKVRELFQQAATYDGFFGRCQIFLDVGGDDGPDLKLPLFVNKATITKGQLRRLQIIEPTYTYPYQYNAANPLAANYYKPSTWFVMGNEVHSSRLLNFVSRPVPDLLKPSYNFGGLSMTQLARPYVDNWLKVRNSVGRLVQNYSTRGIKTNLAATLSGADEGDDMIGRATLFSATSDNQGLMLLDKDSEEFFQSSTPLTTIDKLQAQSQEHMASVSSTPLVVLLGITPAGLNASSDGEIRVYYDFINSQQQILFRDNLEKLLDILQLHCRGVIDPSIKFEFVSLWEMNEKDRAAIRKSNAEASAIYVEMGAVMPDEVREELSADPESGYTGLSTGTGLAGELPPDPAAGALPNTIPSAPAAPALPAPIAQVAQPAAVVQQ